MNFKQYVQKGSFYAAVVEDGSDLIFLVDFDGNIHYHNSSVRGTLGYKGRTLNGKNFFDFIPLNTVDDLKEKFKQSRRRAYTEKVEIQFLCKDRSYKFLEFNAINLKHKVGLNGFILDCRDITQRKRDAEELVRLQKAKEQFLANISHEIRTPINGIAGMAGLLSQESSPEERGTYLNAIRHSAENLKVIINDILDLAAIDSGKLRFEYIPFNLHDLLPSVVSMFAYQAKEKKIGLEYNIQPSLRRILLGDPVRLNQILINLISNAVKFTHSGKIQVECSAENKEKNGCLVKIQVIDTGVGVPSDKLDTIFESFSQADASVTRKYGGSGLGLTIVKQLVELQHGTIEVKSKEHKGSNFIVRIPYSFAKSDGVNKTARPTTPQPSDKKLVGMKVLLVEDNDINRLYAKSILRQWNCMVDIAENGLVAIEKIKYNFYDVVLMDVQMPVMDGYEATRAIRVMESHMRHAPIVALTANATKADIEKCLSSGMNDYLPKPFTPEDLYRKISSDLNIQTKANGTATPLVANRKNTFDLAYLRSISDNNHEFLQEMLQTFMESIPPVLREMEAAMSEENWKNLSRLAHQIKPSFSLMGMNTLRKSVLYIEQNGEQQANLAELINTTKAFIRECNAVVADVRKEIISG